MHRNGFTVIEGIGLLVMGLAIFLGYLLISRLAQAGLLLLVLGGLLVVAGPSLYFLYGRRLAREVQALQSTQHLAAEVIREVQATDISAGGFRLPVEVQGIIECEEILSEEEGAKPCAYHALRVERVMELPDRSESIEPVHDETKTGAFWVKDHSGRIKVIPEGALIDPPATKESFIAVKDLDRSPWKGLLERYLRPATGKGPTAMRVKGFRLYERHLPAGQRVKVVGVASDALGELAILHPDQPDQPFLISAGADVSFLELKRRRWQGAAALSAACLVGGLGMGVLGVYSWLPTLKTGEIYIRNETDHTVRLTVDKQDGSLRQVNWTYAPLEGTNYPHGTRMDYNKKPLVVQPGDQISFMALRSTPPVKLVTGTASGVVWNNKDWTWRVTVTEELLREGEALPAGRPSIAVTVPPTTSPAPSRRLTVRKSGRFYVKNLTGRKFSLTLHRPDGTKLHDTNWTFDPFEGKEKTKGLYLTYRDTAITPETGYLVKLSWLDASGSVFTYPLDNSGPVKWNDIDGNWTFYVGEGVSSYGSIWIKNLTNRQIEAQVFNPQGQPTGEKWSLESREGTEDPAAVELKHQGTPVELQRGDILVLTALKPGPPVEGVIGKDPFFQWNSRGRFWNVTLNDALLGGK